MRLSTWAMLGPVTQSDLQRGIVAPLDIPRGWRIFELGARDDYFEYWSRIREHSPVIDAGEGVYLVSSWDLVSKALRHPDLRAGSGTSQAFGGATSPVESVVRNWLMSQNGEQHRHARALVSRLFTPSAVIQLESLIRSRAKELAEAFIAAAQHGAVDFVDRVAQRLPSEVVRHLFAVDADEWTAHVQPLFLGDGLTQSDGYAAVQGLTHYFLGKIEGARDRKLGGVLDDLRAPDRQGGHLSEAEVIANSVLIVTAAIETTAGLMANTMLRLLENPEALARLRGDPSLIPGAIDESLRHCPSAPSSTRNAPTAVELGGHKIPPGTDLFLSLAAANRDPAKFEDPNRFKVDRDSSALLTFGGGPHFCLGAALARLEAKLLFEELLSARKDFRLCEPVRWRLNNPSVRAPARLLISCVGQTGLQQLE
jgi:cytochrome P450